LKVNTRLSNTLKVLKYLIPLLVRLFSWRICLAQDCNKVNSLYPYPPPLFRNKVLLKIFDFSGQMVVSSARPLDPPISDPMILQSVTDAIIAALQGARTACILPGVLAVRAGLRDALQSFVDTCGLPFATMLMDKSVLEEQHPAYIGMYDGKLMDESVRAFVESCDLVLIIGAMMTDISTGGFTAHLDPEKTINIRHHLTQVGSIVYPNVEMKDVLTELTRHVKKRTEKSPIKPVSLGAKVGSGSDPITVEALYLGKLPQTERYSRCGYWYICVGTGICPRV
jgi:TPP-dependent 2-oxoacid decarboxylase